MVNPVIVHFKYSADGLRHTKADMPAEVPNTQGPEAPSPTPDEQPGGLAARAAFLVVMAYVSSLVASKGLELFYAARGADRT